MLDDDSPGLGVDFIIDAGDSFGELARLAAVMDSTEAKVLADANRIEKATGGMINLVGATASVQTFGGAATRELAATAREMRSVEKAGEGMLRQLERQNASFGKTREELRAVRAEERAVAAERVGNTDLARRLRAEEADLFAKELAASRASRFEIEAASQDKAAAAARAIAAAEAEATAIRAAANAHSMFEAAARRGMAALREQEALQAAAKKEQEAQAVRSAARAYEMFEARVRQGAAALREQEAAEKTAARDVATARLQREAAATAKLAEEHARLAALVRGSQAAQEADAAAAERLRAATDPLYAATARLNAEIAESIRLYHAGATAPAEYARQQEVLTGRLRTLTADQDAHSAAMRRGASSMTQMSFQANDVITMWMSGSGAGQIFATQIGQIFQVAQMAEGGVKGFAGELGGLLLRFAPLAAATAVAGVTLYRWKEQLNDDAGLKKYVDGLGLTQKELKKLKDQSLETGDIIAGLWKTISDGAGLNGSGKSIMDYLFSPDDAKQVQAFVASIYGTFAGGYDAIVQLWGEMSSVVSGYVSAAAAAASRFFAPVVAAAQWAGNAVGQIFSSIYNWAAGWVKSIAGAISPILSAIGHSDAATAVAGAGNRLGTTFGDAYAKRVASFVAGSNAIVAKVGANAVDHAQERLKKKADQLIADRTPKKPTVDHHAEQLARQAEAIEAQIRNLYKLADAYGVSGAAALIAEARVKAESQAIKQRADIEAAVDRQIRLAIAQRVSDAAKSSAAMRDQAQVQAEVNALVANGNIPAERAADLVRDRMADLPLLAAIEAAQQRGLTAEADRATKALNDQHDAQEQAKAAAIGERFTQADATADKRLAELREELRLVGATDAARVHALATLRATQEAEALGLAGAYAATYIAKQVEIADGQQALTDKQNDYNDALTFTADQWDLIGQNVQSAAQGMSQAFGAVGGAIGDMASIYASYAAQRARADQVHQANLLKAGTQAAKDRENARFALANSTAQVGAYGDMAAAAKGFFQEGSSGYQALATAEKVFRAVQFAMSVKAMAQDAIETGTSIANSVARTAVAATEAVVNAIKSLPFPLNIAAGAATIAALAGIGVSIAGSFGGGGSKPAPSNTGTGTVLGDPAAKSDSIKNAIDALKEVDTVTNTFAREMAASLRSIDGQIGNVAALVVRSGDINASAGVAEGFKANAIGSVLKTVVPIFGGALASLFGSSTTVTAAGLYGRSQSVGSILGNGFDASTYSDVQKKSKFLGITTGTKTSTQYANADPGLENQFTLILRQFDTAIAAAAGPLGAATDQVQNRLNSFVVNIGKIDLKGLTGDEIQEKLSAIFGAAADGMANAAFPGMQRFQKVGEGAFETLVRVASTVEAVTSALGQLGTGARGLGIDAKLGLADQFDSVGDLTSAVDGYFQAFYSDQEQAAAKTAQLGNVFASLGLAMPSTLAGFRQLVEAQDLTTAAGQATYATLLQLAPAFADLQSAMEGAKSAADIASERQDLQRQLLELQGNTAAIRALDLAKLDASNRALQEQIYAIQDAQEAARAADELRQAWTSVGDSIMDEVKRIRGLSDAAGGNGFATLLGQFNAANAAARGGDIDAAKGLPALSQALLKAAADAATSRQELERVQAQTAAALEATYGVVGALTTSKPASTTAQVTAAAASQCAVAPATANDDVIGGMRALREEVAGLRRDNNAGHAATANNTGRIDRRLDDVTADSGGQAISVAYAA